jgi:hypothetical protein
MNYRDGSRCSIRNLKDGVSCADVVKFLRKQRHKAYISIYDFRYGTKQEMDEMFNEFGDHLKGLLISGNIPNTDWVVKHVARLCKLPAMRVLGVIFASSLSESHCIELFKAVKSSFTIERVEFGALIRYSDLARKQIIDCVRGHISLYEIGPIGALNLYPIEDRAYVHELLYISQTKKSRILVILLVYAKRYCGALRDVFLALKDYLV